MILTETYGLQNTQDIKDYIWTQISSHGGRITFAEYMQHALYAPGLGYYNAGNIKLGPQGDFITAPEMGSLFAKCLSKQLQEVLQAYSKPKILEFGAGSGRLAGDLLTQLELINCLPDQYLILELSPDLRWRQQELIAQTYPQYAHLVHWLDHLPAEKFNGVLIANEVLDAMPVNKFLYTDDALKEYYVHNINGQLEFCLDAATSPLAEAFNKNNIASYIMPPYTSEINLWIDGWIQSLANILNSGAILFCDYGFARAQYYHPQRNTGTLMCHYQHRSHPDPLINVGLQDITAHVDFTHVAEAAIANELYVGGFTNLASFLINCGITDLLDPTNIAQMHEVNTLTSPAEMGELFKVILLTRMQQEDFLGFKQFDKTSTL